MKPQLSPLLLLDFAILNSNFKFLAPQGNFDLTESVSSYALDIDFAIVQEATNTRVFIKASINQIEEMLPGYAIFAEGVAVFGLNEKANLSAADKNNLLQYAAVSIALNSLRGFIAALTANAPFGKYLLPSIDVNHLFMQKNQLAKKTTVKKKR